MSKKWERAMQVYSGHKGEATIAHIERNIQAAYPTAWKELTGCQYGAVMNVANRSFQDGCAFTGAWREAGLVGFDDVCLPEKLLRSIRKVERVEYEYSPAEPGGGSDPLSWLMQWGDPPLYRRLPDGEYVEIDSEMVPGTRWLSRWQRAQLLLPERVYTRTARRITDYYIGDMLIFTERY